MSLKHFFFLHMWQAFSICPSSQGFCIFRLVRVSDSEKVRYEGIMKMSV